MCLIRMEMLSRADPYNSDLKLDRDTSRLAGCLWTWEAGWVFVPDDE